MRKYDYDIEQKGKGLLRDLSAVQFKLAKIQNKLEGNPKTKTYYRKTPENQVPEKYRIRAEKILRFSLRILNLGNIQIKWMEFAGCGEEEKYYSYEVKECDDIIFGTIGKGNEVFLRHDIPLKDMEFTLAHELHHLWFNKKYEDQYPYEKESYMWERTANGFAEKVLSELWALEHKAFPLPTFLSKN